MDQARSIKNERVILKALAEAGQSKVAGMIDVHESSVSKAKNDIQLLAKIMAACGLKVVPDTVRCFDPGYIEALQQLAKEHLRTTSETPTLEWD